MGGWLARWREFGAALALGFSRFPIAVVSLAIFAVEVNLVIAKTITIDDDELFRAGVALVGGAALATAAVLFGERRAIPALPRHLLSLLLAALIGAALWYWDRLLIAYPALFAVAVLTIPLAPYARREPAGFWTFIWRLIHAAALALIATIVFCLGLSAIFATIHYLFGVKIESSLYGHIWSIGLGFVGPLFALSLIPAEFPEHDAPNGADIFVAGLRMLADFVAVPLLAAYTVILHIYALKILVERELPKGQVGWMVLTFGLAVLALRIAVHPMGGLARASTRLFLRFWPIGLVVPLMLLLIALWQRIAAYGVTPERYALGLFAVFLGVVLLAQFHRPLRDDIRIIPAVGALALFVASFGVWGMFAVSTRSQTDRLMHHLTDAGVLQNGRITGTPKFSRGAAEDVRSIVLMLEQIKQVDRLRPLFAGESSDPFLPPDKTDRSELVRLWKAFGVDTLPPGPDQAGDFLIRGSGAVAIGDYDIVVPDLSLTGTRAADVVLGDGLPAVRVQTKETAIEIASGDVTLTITPNDLRDAVKARIETVETRLEDERPPFFVELTLKGRKVGLLFGQIVGSLPDAELKLSGASFDLYLRRADWPTASGGEPFRGPQP